MTFRFGIDELLADPYLVRKLKSARVALMAHPASVTSGNLHTVDALAQAGCKLVKAFGPQHGMRGDAQDNMIESSDYLDPVHHIPVVSLYGEHRRPTEEMLHDIDILLYDLQDIGCRIYTYITSLRYLMEACAAQEKEIWVLDRPNPAGRPVDGLALEAGEESFVGCVPMPIRHGMTVGELSRYLAHYFLPDCRLRVVGMTGYEPNAAPGYGWPVGARPWVNPSPNAASVNMARCFPGSVLLEGTELSEGRGTTVPLEVLGAPGLDIQGLLSELMQEDPDCVAGAYIRPCHFIPTFHKHADTLCAGLQIHTEVPSYRHADFKPYRLYANLLKLIRRQQPGYNLWRHHEYEYEFDRIPIDVINGGPGLREWVDSPAQDFAALRKRLDADAAEWLPIQRGFSFYS